MSGKKTVATRYRMPSFDETPSFQEMLARLSLASINPGPDGVTSMSQCQCDTMLYETKEHHIFYDDFKLLKSGARSPASTSPLLALPKRVRQKIYSYVVAYPDPIPIREHKVTKTIRQTAEIVRESWFFTPPLLRTCLKIEKDATPLFFANNRFRVELTDGTTNTLHAWLENTSPVYLAQVYELIISLEPRTFFDVDTLRKQLTRDSKRSPAPLSTTASELSKAITDSGISANRIVMTSPVEMKHVYKDAKLVGRGVRDAPSLRDLWFDDLQHWLDHDEYEALTIGDAAGYTLVTSKMAALLGKG
ncbi:hypothetical protein LTR08_007353 [Meristemomyces frigidus]|nr:hypothetical protein LTR08_007353 [Meristemomyces frigidus]